MPTTKSGEKITWKEFGHRWADGVRAVTPMQQVKINLFGNFLVIVGILWGLYFATHLDYGWLFTILLGSLFVSGVGMLGTVQRYLALLKLEQALKGGLEHEQ